MRGRFGGVRTVNGGEIALHREKSYSGAPRPMKMGTTRSPERVLRRLDRLDAAATPQEINIPGFDFHALRGFKPTRYSVHVNGPWCITFEFEDGDACRVDFEQYH